jgi:DNA repair protein RadC
VANLLGIEMAPLEQEQLRVVLLDTKHRILGSRTVYQGSVNQAQVRLRVSQPQARQCLDWSSASARSGCSC